MSKQQLKSFFEQNTEILYNRKSFYIVIIVAVLLLIAILFGAWQLRKVLDGKIHDKSIDIDKVNNFQFNYNSEGEVKITEDELKYGLQNSSLPLYDTKVKISSDGIIISGRTGKSFLSLPIEVKIIPIAHNGNADFEIITIKSRGVTAPKNISDSLEKQLKSYSSKNLILSDDYKLKEIKLYDRFMIIYGEIKR